LPDRPCPICFFAAPDVQKAHSHLARHLERFALFALPRFTCDEDDDAEIDSAAAVDATQSSRNLSSDSSAGTGAERDGIVAAAEAGNLARVEDLLDDVSTSDSEKEAALVKAAAAGHGDIVKIILDHGTSVNCCNNQYTPLIAASASGFVDIVADLITRGADVNLSLENDFPEEVNALMAASANGYTDVVKVLISSGAELETVADFQWPLSIASQRGHDDVVVALIDAGAQVNYLPLDSTETALREAVGGHHHNTAKILIEKGAKPNLYPRVSELESAVIQDDEDLVKLMIQAGAHVDWRASNGETILQTAAGYARTGVVRLLLQAGADTNEDGHTTALHLAIGRDNEASTVARLLLEAGARPNALNSFGETPLHLACMRGDDEMVKLLLDAGADPNASIRRSGGALEIARKAGHKKTSDLLLSVGATTESTTYSMSALHDLLHQEVELRMQPAELPRQWQINQAFTDSGDLRLELLHDLAVPHTVACAAFSTDGELLALGSLGAATIFRVQTMTQETTFPHSVDGCNVYVRAASFSPDGRFVLTGAEDGRTRLWEVENSQTIFVMEQDPAIYTVAYSNGGTWIATGASDGSLRMYNISESIWGEVVVRDHGITSLIFSPDDRFIAVGDLGGNIALVEVDENRIRPFSQRHGHADSVMSLCFSEDGSKVYSGSLDKTIKDWSLIFDAQGLATSTETIQGHQVSPSHTVPSPSADPFLRTACWLLQ
jgi:uncharacterized protein